MPLNLVSGCNQSQFKARPGGSCWGIAFMFCQYAIDKGAVAGADLLFKDGGAPDRVEELMKLQDGIHSTAAPLYLRDSNDKPISDLNTPEGFRNQNLAVQLRHNAIKELASKHGMRCIGTLSSFIEGGVPDLARNLIRLGSKAGFSAVQMSLQQPKGHAVSLFLEKNDHLYFFDPNKGLHIASDMGTVADELAAEVKGYAFSIGHVFLKA